MEPAPHRGNQSHRVEKAGALTLLVVGFLLLLLLRLLFFGFFLGGGCFPFFVLFCFVLDEISVHPPTHTHTLIVLRCTFPPLWLVSHAEIHVSMT